MIHTNVSDNGEGGPGSVRAFNLNFGGESTGIVSMSTDSKDLKDSGAWYDMQGRKLNTKPAKSGLYIHRGNKVVVK